MSKTKTGPDVAELQREKLPEAAFPGAGGQAFRVFLDEDVYAQIQKHAAEDTEVEVCGVLVGKLQRDANGPYVAISAAIPGDAANNKYAEVTFTHDTWAKINARMDQEFTDRAIVGWYHTHPDFGIFLSDRDRFIHEHFFSGPGQVAYVVDPVRKEEGMFTWAGGKPTPSAYYWVGSRLQMGAGDEEAGPEVREARRQRARADGDADGQRAPAPPDDRVGPVLSWATRVAIGLCLLLLGYVYAARQQALLVEGTLAQYGIIKALHVGINDDLDTVNRELGQLGIEMIQQANADLRPIFSEDDLKARSAAWNQVAGRLLRTQQVVSLLKAKYGLSPEELDLVQRLKVLSGEVPATQPAAPATQPARLTPNPPATAPATQPAGK